ncbi:MAG TPA: TolC family protein [Bryobacteraceae bacterium]|jgi:outer membrane protein TolC|nr:TolC family protein [Bryobacteraceae bacterium]
MRKLALFFFSFVLLLTAENHKLTLQQTLELAARQNPDVTLARLDQNKAEEGIRVAQDPFHPKLFTGSGAAYTYGYPNTIEGSAPAIFQVTTQEALFNRPKSYELAASRELARASEYGALAKTDEVAYEAADLFLRASQIEHAGQTLTSQIPDLQKVVDTMSAAVTEGSELPLELKRARVNLASSVEQLSSTQLDEDYYEMNLAVVVGYPATDRVKPIDSNFLSVMTPSSEADAVDTALRNSEQMRQMQSNILAKEMDLRSFKSARWPTVDLVAQYALFAKYTYSQYFPSTKFQRNNFQLGAAVTIPLLLGTARGGYMAQAYTDVQKLRIQADQLRNHILVDTRRSYQQWKKAENLRDLARMKLDLAREDLTVKLAQNGEGRVPLRELEQSRLDESDLWMQLYDAEAQVTRAKLAILRQMGTLTAAILNQDRGAQPSVNHP